MVLLQGHGCHLTTVLHMDVSNIQMRPNLSPMYQN